MTNQKFILVAGAGAVIILMVIAAGFLLLKSPGAVVGITAQDGSAFLRINTPIIAYGQNLSFAILAPPVLSGLATIGTPQSYDAIVRASDLYISVDGQQVVGANGAVQNGAFVPSVILASAPQTGRDLYGSFYYDYVAVANSYQPNMPIVNFSMPPYLSLGQHTLTTTWSGRNFALGLLCPQRNSYQSDWCSLNSAGSGGVPLVELTQYTASVNFTIINGSASCNGTLNNGMCYVLGIPAQSSCAAGASRMADACVYSIAAPLSGQAQIAAQQAIIDQLNFNLAVLQVQLNQTSQNLSNAQLTLAGAEMQVANLTASNQQTTVALNNATTALLATQQALNQSLQTNLIYRLAIDSYASAATTQANAVITSGNLSMADRASILSLQNTVSQARAQAISDELAANQSNSNLAASVSSYLSLKSQYNAGQASLASLQTQLATVQSQLTAAQTAATQAQTSAQNAQQAASQLGSASKGQAQGTPIPPNSLFGFGLVGGAVLLVIIGAYLIFKRRH